MCEGTGSTLNMYPYLSFMFFFLFVFLSFLSLLFLSLFFIYIVSYFIWGRTWFNSYTHLASVLNIDFEFERKRAMLMNWITSGNGHFGPHVPEDFKMTELQRDNDDNVEGKRDGRKSFWERQLMKVHFRYLQNEAFRAVVARHVSGGAAPEGWRWGWAFRAQLLQWPGQRPRGDRSCTVRHHRHPQRNEWRHALPQPLAEVSAPVESKQGTVLCLTLTCTIIF